MVDEAIRGRDEQANHRDGLGQNGEDDGPDKDPEFESAIARSSAPFAYWVSAWYFSRRKFNDDRRSRERYVRYRELIYSPFEAEHGPVLESFYCEEFPAAAAITQKRVVRWRWFPWWKGQDWTLHIVSNTPDGAEDDAEAVAALDLLADAEHIAIEANDFLTGRSKYVVIDMTYALVGELLRILDSAARRLSRRKPEQSNASGSPTPTPRTDAPSPEGSGADQRESKIVEDARERKNSIRTYFGQSATRQGQFSFLRGLAVSIAVITVGALIILPRSLEPPVRNDVLAVVMASAVGAAASVLQRMKASGIEMDYRVGRTQLFILGASRPLLGVIAGTLLYFGVVAGVIPLDLPVGAKAQVALFAVAAFFAGFNERFVDDMLGDFGRRLAPGSTGTAERAPNEQVASASDEGSRE